MGGLEGQLVLVQVLAHDGEDLGIERARVEQDAQVVGIGVGAGHDAVGLGDAGRRQIGLGRPADDLLGRGLALVQAGIDHHGREPDGGERVADVAAHAAQSAQHPAAFRRREDAIQGRPGAARDPLAEGVDLGVEDGRRQIARVGLKRVDDVDVAAESREDLFVVGRGRLDDDAQIGVQEARRHRDLEVHLLVGGERHHGLAVGPLQTRLDQGLGNARIGAEAGHVDPVVAQLQSPDALDVPVEHHGRDPGVA